MVSNAKTCSQKILYSTCSQLSNVSPSKVLVDNIIHFSYQLCLLQGGGNKLT